MGCCQSTDESEEGNRGGRRRDRGDKRRDRDKRRRRGDDDGTGRQPNASNKNESLHQEPKKDVHKALFKYEPGSPSEVALEKGDRVELLSKEPGGFAFVRELKMHGTRGYVPMDYLAVEGSPAEEEFYYGEIRRQDADKLLRDEKLAEGAFLVRGPVEGAQTGSYDVADADGGSETCSPYVISVKDGSTPTQVHHYRIRQSASGHTFYIRNTKKFNTLAELVTYYQTNPPGKDLCSKLTTFLPRPIPPRRELSQEMRDRWREIPREQLELTKLLGEGRFGEVHKGTWKPAGGQPIPVVAKHLKKLELIDRQSLLNEAGMMKDIINENIVRLFGVVSSSEPYLIVTEFVKDGSIQDYLKNRRRLRLPPMEANDLIDCCAQICRGMAYLASKRIVHRDLAARNVLIDVKSTSPFSCTVKICDFGLARTLNKDYVYKMKHETYIAVRWLAPEGFSTIFSTETDVWAFGVTLAEIFNGGEDPWQDLDEKEVKIRIQSGRGPDKPRDMPASVYAIMKRCCQRDPKSRPSFQQLAQEFDALLPESKRRKTSILVKSQIGKSQMGKSVHG